MSVGRPGKLHNTFPPPDHPHCLVITLMGKRELIALLFFGLWLVYHLGLFALLLGVTGTLCSVIVALPGHLLYHMDFLYTGCHHENMPI